MAKDTRTYNEKQHDKVAPNNTGRQRDAQQVGKPGESKRPR